MLTTSLAIPLRRQDAKVLLTFTQQFHQWENRVAEDSSLYGFVQILLKGICIMQDKNSSLSTDQHVDAFKRALGNALRGILGFSNDTLPSGLPTPVKPAASHPEKGIKSDKSG